MLKQLVNNNRQFDIFGPGTMSEVIHAWGYGVYQVTFEKAVQTQG